MAEVILIFSLISCSLGLVIIGMLLTLYKKIENIGEAKNA